MNGRGSSSEPRAGIDALRAGIDDIDARLLDLLNRRAELALRIGAIKRTGGLRVEDRGREAELVGTLLARNDGPLTDEDVVEIWTTIIAQSRRLQTSLRT